MSFAKIGMINSASSSIVWSSIAKIVGASLTGKTVKIKLPDPEARPSVASTLTSISPLKSWSGVTVNVEPSTIALPLPSTLASKVRGSSSISSAFSSRTYTPSSAISAAISSPNCGASLTGFIVNVNVVDPVYSPSFASTVTSTSPL